MDGWINVYTADPIRLQVRGGRDDHRARDDRDGLLRHQGRRGGWVLTSTPSTQAASPSCTHTPTYTHTQTHTHTHTHTHTCKQTHKTHTYPETHPAARTHAHTCAYMHASTAKQALLSAGG